MLGETEAGAGETRQVIVLVKPMRSGLRTNLVLTTDQRTYLFEVTVTDAKEGVEIFTKRKQIGKTTGRPGVAL